MLRQVPRMLSLFTLLTLAACGGGGGDAGGGATDAPAGLKRYVGQWIGLCQQMSPTTSAGEWITITSGAPDELQVDRIKAEYPNGSCAGTQFSSHTSESNWGTAETVLLNNQEALHFSSPQGPSVVSRQLMQIRNGDLFEGVPSTAQFPTTVDTQRPFMPLVPVDARDVVGPYIGVAWVSPCVATGPTTSERGVLALQRDTNRGPAAAVLTGSKETFASSNACQGSAGTQTLPSMQITFVPSIVRNGVVIDRYWFVDNAGDRFTGALLRKDDRLFSDRADAPLDAEGFPTELDMTRPATARQMP